jgi:ankyrin repeat protein
MTSWKVLGRVNLCAALIADAKAAIDLPNHKGSTPLYVAAQHGHVKVIKALLRGGASVHLPNHNGFTPLLIACQHGHVDVVRQLLSAGNGTGDLSAATKAGAGRSEARRGLCALICRGTRACRLKPG